MVTAVPEIMVEQLRADHDFMIIACDGIWDCLSSQQAVDFVYETREKLLKKGASGASLKAPAKSLTGVAPNRKGVVSPAKKIGATGALSQSALALSKSNSTSTASGSTQGGSPTTKAGSAPN